jgi:hypothetical protein
MKTRNSFDWLFPNLDKMDILRHIYDESNPLMLKQVYLWKVEPKEISKVLDVLRVAIPLESLTHLKRVKKIGNEFFVLFCEAEKLEQVEDTISLLKIDKTMLVKTDVPSTMAKRRKNLATWTKIWPISRAITNQDIENEEYVLRIPENELKLIRQNMKLVFDYSSKNVRIRSCVYFRIMP